MLLSVYELLIYIYIVLPYLIFWFMYKFIPMKISSGEQGPCINIDTRYNIRAPFNLWGHSMYRLCIVSRHKTNFSLMLGNMIFGIIEKQTFS